MKVSKTPYPIKNNKIDWYELISYYTEYGITLNEMWDNDFKTLEALVRGKKRSIELLSYTICHGVKNAYGKTYKPMFKEKVDPNKEKEMKDRLTKTFGL